MSLPAVEEPKCVKCDDIADCDSPTFLCDKHWTMWFNYELEITSEEKAQRDKAKTP